MYGQILTNKDGDTIKILGVLNELIFISATNDYKTANNSNCTKEDLIDCGWIFPIEKWTPEMDEKYYTPYTGDVTKYISCTWTNNKTDKHFLANNLVCRTKEEAIALTDKMLGAVRV